MVLFAVSCYAERDNAGGSMEKRELKITTIGKPDISSLPKDTAKMFYAALLAQALEFYRHESSDLYQDCHIFLYLSDCHQLHFRI